MQGQTCNWVTKLPIKHHPYQPSTIVETPESKEEGYLSKRGEDPIEERLVSRNEGFWWQSIRAVQKIDIGRFLVTA